MTPDDLILNAREAAKSRKWDEADRLYKRAIRILATKQSRSPDLRESYLSTKAEHLCNKPYLPDRESLDDLKKRWFDAIRCLNECSKISKKNSDHYVSIMNELVQRIIKQYGCTLFETEHHVVESCPIRLSSGKSGRMGTSIGVTYKKILCSICGLNMLDENCTHVRNRVYDGKRCSPVYVGLQRKDVSVVRRPKDPLCLVTDVFCPKEEFLQDCGIDASKIDLRQKLKMQCTHCRDENIDLSSITPEIFLKIHGLNISMDKPRVISTPKYMKKGGRYFSSIVYTEGGNLELGL